MPTYFDKDGMLRQTGRKLRYVHTTPIPVNLWAAGFSFSRSSIITHHCSYPGAQGSGVDCSMDHLFFGEEMLMTAR